jgi:apolipoprotein N-acyltransferase
LFWGAAFRLARRVASGGWTLALALAAAWTLAEYARAHVLTGFPWALPAYAWAGVPVSQTLSLFGPHMLGFLTLALAALPGGLAARPRAAGAALAAAAALVAGAWIWGEARLARPAPPEGPVIRLVQPNAGQREKWRPDMIPVFFERLRDLSVPEPGRPAPALVIWPETAVPWLLEREADTRRLIAQGAGGAPVLLGARRVEPDAAGVPRWRNAAQVIGPQGDILGHYDKRHLVPFGEYIPLYDLLSTVGIGPMVAESGGFSEGDGPARLSLPALPDVAPQICYETIFPHRMPRPGTDRVGWMVQLTNDAWFGASAGPWQHFHQARMRTIEQGLPLARAANTGISAVIDARGRVVTSLPLLEAGAIQAPLPGALPPTLYARSGDLPWMAAVLAALGLAALGSRRRAG